MTEYVWVEVHYKSKSKYFNGEIRTIAWKLPYDFIQAVGIRIKKDMPQKTLKTFGKIPKCLND